MVAFFINGCCDVQGNQPHCEECTFKLFVKNLPNVGGNDGNLADDEK